MNLFDSELLSALVTGVLAVGLMFVATPIVIRLAHKFDWLAHPKADRWHEKPTALMGGIAIFAAAAIAYFALAFDASALPIWVGAILMFITGLVDDLKNIRPATKLVAQVVATGILVVGGYAFASDLPVYIYLPLTFVWVIGITNAINLLDNMDGLASGISCIAALVLAGFSYMEGGVVGAGIAVAIAGAAGGFLFYNFKPAKIFMGDSGSLFLGYMIAALSIVIQAESTSSSQYGIYLVSLVIVAVPILDTTLVTLVRPAAGRLVSQGGRDHTSHRLVFLGLSEKAAVLVLYGISLVFGALALAFHIAKPQLFYALVIFMGVSLTVFGIFLGGVNVYRDDERKEQTFRGSVGKVQMFVYATMGYSWKVIFGVIGDILLVIAAFISSYFLRFEAGVTPERASFITAVLPVVVAVKIPVFYAFGLYRGIWRYAGTIEFVRVVKATVLSSVVTFLLLGTYFGLGTLSKGVFVIDWMVVTIALVAVRFSFRFFPQLLASRRIGGRRVLLYGAGDAGVLVLREIRQNPDLGYNPLGFIDDDLSKVGHLVQGLQVLGTRTDLQSTCEDQRIEEVLITTTRLSDKRASETVRFCESMGIPCRTVTVNIYQPDAIDAIEGLVGPAVARAS